MFSFVLKDDVGVHTPETCRKLEVLVNEIAPIVFLSERISNFALKLSIARLGSTNRLLSFELDWSVPENAHLLLKYLKRFHLFRRIIL